MDERVATRIGALHLARQRRSLRESAWAAARLRLQGVRLDPNDSSFARNALLSLGRAIRLANARRDHATGHELTPIEFAEPLRPWQRPELRRPLIIVTILAALFIVVLVLLPAGQAQPQAASGGGVPAVGGAAPTALPLRGRSQQLVAVSTPAPTATAVPTSAASGQPGIPGSGSGGAAGGGGTALPTPTPSVMVLSIFVSDAKTNQGIPGVCVTDGSTSCDNAPITDARGNATMRLSIGQLWHLEFKRTGYVTKDVEVFSNVAANSIIVSLTPGR